jgi:caffeoyl-CoA O-methyltransferase
MSDLSPQHSSPIPRPVTPHAILAATLADLARDAESIPGLPPAFRQRLGESASLATGLEPYLTACSSPESPGLAEIARHTREVDWERLAVDGETAAQLEREMLSGHLEGQFLKILVRATRAKRALEIGLFTGYSALAIAEALPAEGTLVACELDPYAAQFARDGFASSPHGPKIEVKVGPASATLSALARDGAAFDFVFIDANKDGYLEYLHALADGSLLAPNALICVDNTLMQGQPYLGDPPTGNGAAIAAFNAALAADPRFEQVLLPIRDGVTLIQVV